MEASISGLQMGFTTAFCWETMDRHWTNMEGHTVEWQSPAKGLSTAEILAIGITCLKQ